MLTPKQKVRIIKKHNLHDADTGSPEVQVAILSDEIRRLTLHLKKHSKDHSSRRGLLKMVEKRKSLLDYLREKNNSSYNKLAKALGLS